MSTRLFFGFFFCTLLFFTSCEKDDNIDVSNQENKEKINSFGTSIYELEDNDKFSNALKGILDNGSLKSRSAESFGIRVDSSYVQVLDVREKGFKTYTMLMQTGRGTQESFSNLVIKTFNDSENVEAYVFQYLPDEPMQYYEPDQSYTFGGTANISFVDTGFPNETMSQTCITINITMCENTANGVGTGPLHFPGPNCKDRSKFVNFPFNNCFGVPEYNPGNPVAPGENLNNCLREDCRGGGSGTSINESDIPTEPVFVTVQTFIQNPSQETTNWWNFYTPEQAEDREDKKDQIADFLNNNKEPGQIMATQEAQDLAEEMIAADNDGSLISIKPFVKYPEGSNYESQYPNLTDYLKNDLPDLSEDDLIVDALEQYGSLSEQQIEDALKWGNESSTTIEIIDSNYMPFGAYGCYRVCGTGPNTIVISSALADALENNSTISKDALNFFVGLIIMHEITHMGDFLYNGDMYSGEEGNDFEMKVTGTQMQDPNDAEEVYQGYLLNQEN